jgi:hypothetical protein
MIAIKRKESSRTWWARSPTTMSTYWKKATNFQI